MTNQIIEVHDTSALDALTKEREAHSRSKILIASGAGGLLFGLGLAAAFWGWSKIREPRIITTEKLVVQEKVVQVDRPVVTEKVVTVDRPVVTEKVVTVDRPVVTERVERVEVPTPMPQQPPAMTAPQTYTPPPQPYTPTPNLGDRTSENQFKNSEGFQTTQIRGKIVSHENGTLLFENGQKFYDMNAAGTGVDTKFSNPRHVGDTAFCNETGRNLPNGMAEVRCYALHNGVVETTQTLSPSLPGQKNIRRQSDDFFDPLADLFN